MASLTAAIQQIRRTRRQLDSPPLQNFDRYRPEYESILAEIEVLADDTAFDELHKWMIHSTKEQNRLPTPSEVRTRARQICASRGIDVPSDSALRE